MRKKQVKSYPVGKLRSPVTFKNGDESPDQCLISGETAEALMYPEVNQKVWKEFESQARGFERFRDYTYRRIDDFGAQIHNLNEKVESLQTKLKEGK